MKEKKISGKQENLQIKCYIWRMVEILWWESATASIEHGSQIVNALVIY